MWLWNSHFRYTVRRSCLPRLEAVLDSCLFMKPFHRWVMYLGGGRTEWERTGSLKKMAECQKRKLARIRQDPKHGLFLWYLKCGVSLRFAIPQLSYWSAVNSPDNRLFGDRNVFQILLDRSLKCASCNRQPAVMLIGSCPPLIFAEPNKCSTS